MDWPLGDFCPLWKEPDLALALIGCVTFSKSLSFSGPLVGKGGLRFSGPCSPPEATGFVQPGPPSRPARPGGPSSQRPLLAGLDGAGDRAGFHCLAASS